MNTTTHQLTVEANRDRLENTCQALGSTDGLNTVCIAPLGHEANAHHFIPSHNLRGIDADGQPVYAGRETTSPLQRVTYRVLDDSTPGRSIVAKRLQPTRNADGTFTMLVNLNYARSVGHSDAEALPRIVSIAHPFSTITPEQVEIVSTEEVTE